MKRIQPNVLEAAFTLIELLVVVAIIAILAGILLPALASAKDRGLRTRCIANNKQLGLATHLYCNDNNDFMAEPIWGNAYQGWLYDPGKSGTPPKLDFNNIEKCYGGGLLWKYTGNYRMYFCPTDKTNAAQNKWWARRENKLSTYIMNGAVNAYGAYGNPPGSKTYRITDFNPLAYLVWEPDEDNYYKYYPSGSCYNDASSYPSTGEGLGRRHGKKGGLLLAFSGHVDIVSYAKFNKEATNLPGLLHCVPGSKTGD